METLLDLVDNETCSIRRDNSEEIVNLERQVCQIKEEFAKISKHQILGQSIEDLLEIEIHIREDGDTPKYVLKVYGKEGNKVEDAIKQAIDNFIEERHYAFYKGMPQLRREFPYAVGKYLNELKGKSEFWCSKSELGSSLVDNHEIYSFYIIQFNRDRLNKSNTFNGERHPFIDAIKGEWESRFGNKIGKKINYNELFRRASARENFLYFYQDDFNALSAMKYENEVNRGSIIALKVNRDDLFEESIENYDISIILTRTIKMTPDNYKKIRKLLEMTRDGLSLLMNNQGEVFAIGKIKKESNCDFYKICFTNFMEWQFYKNNEEYLRFKNMFPLFPEKGMGMKQEDAELLRKTFGEKRYKKLKEIIECAIQQKHGTMVVFTENADMEVDRLEESAFRINPTKLESKHIEAVTSIDGALVCDEEGVCYAIGVILDGKVAKEADSSRGARYNSAIRYKEMRKDEQKKTFIVIVSEDGYIDCISTI